MPAHHLNRQGQLQADLVGEPAEVVYHDSKLTGNTGYLDWWTREYDVVRLTAISQGGEISLLAERDTNYITWSWYRDNNSAGDDSRQDFPSGSWRNLTRDFLTHGLGNDPAPISFEVDLTRMPNSKYMGVAKCNGINKQYTGLMYVQSALAIGFAPRGQLNHVSNRMTSDLRPRMAVRCLGWKM